MKCEKVPGKNKKHSVIIFTLSTCGWCKKTKELLKALDIEYEYIDVDKLSGEELKRVRDEQNKYNPHGSFPTMVIDGGKQVIIGYKDDQIREVLT
jgi:glutaredoxin